MLWSPPQSALTCCLSLAAPGTPTTPQVALKHQNLSCLRAFAPVPSACNSLSAGNCMAPFLPPRGNARLPTSSFGRSTGFPPTSGRPRPSFLVPPVHPSSRLFPGLRSSRVLTVPSLTVPCPALFILSLPLLESPPLGHCCVPSTWAAPGPQKGSVLFVEWVDRGEGQHAAPSPAGSVLSLVNGGGQWSMHGKHLPADSGPALNTCLGARSGAERQGH